MKEYKGTQKNKFSKEGTPQKKMGPIKQKSAYRIILKN